MRLAPLTLILALVAAAPAQALDGLYGSLGYAAQSFADVDAEFGSVQGRIGWRAHRFLGIEGEVGHGVTQDAFGDVELGGEAAAYVLGVAPLTDRFELFARVGVGTQDLSGQVVCIAIFPPPPGCSLPEADESRNWGVGAQYFLDGSNGVRLDWTRKSFEDADLEADVWSLSYVRRF
jgi:hypothetical protein